jgi:exosortase
MVKPAGTQIVKPTDIPLITFLCTASHSPVGVGDLRHPRRITSGPSLGERTIRKYALNDSRITRSIALGVVGLIATAIVAYWPTWSALWRPHGYFVSFLALCLLYSARHRIASAAIKPLPWALLLLIPCSITAVLFWRSGIQALQLLMLPPLILLAVLAAFGTAVTRAVAVPVAFLYFAAPAWNIILTAPMQDLTLAMTRILTAAIGLPASFHGNLISFQNGITFEVTPGCSGASFLVQGLAVAMLLCGLEQASRARRLRLLGSMVLVALIANWLRVLLIIELGYSSGMRSALATTHHVAFGYFLFVLALAGYVWMATRQSSVEPADVTSALTNPPTWRPSGAYALVLVVLVSIPAVVAIMIRPALARDGGSAGFAQSIAATDGK